MLLDAGPDAGTRQKEASPALTATGGEARVSCLAPTEVSAMAGEQGTTVAAEEASVGWEEVVVFPLSLGKTERSG